MTIYYNFDAGTLFSLSHVVLGTEDTARVPVFIQQVPEGFSLTELPRLAKKGSLMN